MIQKLFSSLLLSMILIGMAFPISAHADVKDYEQEEGSNTNFFSRSYYKVKFFNTPHLSDDKFTMRLYAHGNISGCAHTTGNYVELERTSDTLKIEVVDSEILLDDKKPLYGHHECDINSNESFFDVLLDRKKLMKNGIEHISVRSREYGDFVTVDIKVRKDSIKLTVPGNQQEYNTTFWFLPKDTVVFQAPNAKNRDDVRDAIRAFGINNGLTPIEKVVHSYEFQHDSYNYVVFVDTTGKYTKDLGTLTARTPVGQVTLSKTRYGANGPAEELYNLELVAKRVKNTYNREFIKRLR